ncbi:MAG: endonuclease/exonuclease/phosphatase family protein [Verrucomicrobia bacterium]|nr:endonuclease/exonuclease/phosphatase family protein [Verrucomicrobiota bacterium]
MKKSCFVVCAAGTWLFASFPFPAFGQIPFNSGVYSNHFDSLGVTGSSWTNNLTLPGWYAYKGNGDATNYLAGTGNTGGLYSFGTSGTHPVSDRALGSLASVNATPLAFGVRFTNDTPTPISNITVSCTGEQWRTGSTSTPQALAFSWRVADTPITNSYSGANWSNFPALNFVSPNLSASTNALDGNAATNGQVFSSIALTGVVVNPGQELFLRWLDVNDDGFDNALAIDDLTVTFSAIPTTPPFIITQPQDQSATAGDNVSFTVVASGTAPLSYQWQSNRVSVAGATNDTFTIFNVTTNLNGSTYSVTVTNFAGSTNSETATLTVNLPSSPSGSTNTISLLTYNVKGNRATDWSTNSAQVQAIGRQVQYLNPDIITFLEIPYDLSYEMTNFVNVFLPDYSLARNSGTDGAIRSVIASRFPITRSTSWLDGVDLRSFGYSNANNSLDNFTRDLFEAQVAVPTLPRPLHVFTTHLKATTSDMPYEEASAKRAAEAAAITNFFATNLFVLFPFDPYVLTGDMNDQVTNHGTNTLAIQRFISAPTGLHLTNPTNPITGSINTYSTTAANPGSRIDYIFPCGLLFSNIRTSLVFRTVVLTNPPPPPPLLTNDEKIASDHLPVMMVFNNPYDKPFRLTSITRSNPNVTLQWESVFGQPYRVEASSNLTAWSALASNLTATSNVFTLVTNVTGEARFFRVYRVP